ncbi:MAG: hypothetical protein IJ410_09460 [Oscillospiraceae bacterium]|nr:hypothetical protein [Oscillospiraceae bacterium]
MKKNKYNFPKHATNSNNEIYNQFVEDMYYDENFDGPLTVDDNERPPKWKKNGKLDIYHAHYDNTDPHMDPYTVAQHYIDRTQRPHG